MYKKMKKKKKGFTLIELIVVIAILGILSGIAVPRIGASRTNAANTAHNANIRTIQSAAMMYLAENGNPAAEMNDTTTPTAQSVVENYLQGWPAIPSGAQAGDGSGNNTAIAADAVYTITIGSDGVVTVTPRPADL
ncbi:prepilin-type N-terminal cleavage/methylation domain-containing protein [Fusibacter ferrireducens]|uniref:Prepilin-type N-terminal cleavage/methylation domain-containing protein n=1 Tax=Fusibacter ferrireducens TaxID=2785058 RepID=A0ABR9ZTN8_9FIRM|nr:prepilin-type N-terminal cleavage/methylation domain-containing protein [Fusibacter ferrireducens]MBF4693851.1 prepilin-type N-terminal cleavage/methylation domain-containing protein [Fusibacter ferrireducens]